MKKNVNINVEYITRVEGHGNIVINVKDGKLDTCRLDIVESPRFFEGMLRGRSVFEAQHITSRICGICACGHTLASIQAAEDALGIIPTEQTIKLRKLLLHLEMCCGGLGAGLSFANSFMEELWLRGIFLRRFEPFLKIGGSVLLTSLIFAMLHSFVFYFTPAVIPFFFLNTLSLGLACGYLMMKSDSLWGPVLIHAASDFFLFLAVLAPG